ncbi:MAG TPA: DUF6691 family protein [Polyangiaceae bacterium]|nr:DUF6691 family protein [Polyangiaceae bacterium]
MKGLVTALGCGLLFGVGLCLSGMTDPANIIAFLDVSGKWSPNLAGVMLGAIAVHATWLRLTARSADGTAATGVLPASGKRLDGALVGGAALFGVGWGVSGYCPGPALVALGSGAAGALVFVAAMAAGMVLREGRSAWTIKDSGRRSTSLP